MSQQRTLGANTQNEPLTHTSLVSATPSVEPKMQPSHSVYLGMWTQGLWDDATLTIHPDALVSVQNKIGKKAAIAHFYTGWSNLTNPTFIDQLPVLENNGWRPMVSANPYFFDKCQANGKTLYQAIAQGNCDEFLQSVGTTLKHYGHPLFLRFAWEMNVESMDWSIQKSGSAPADYVQAWRRFHDIVVSQGATNVIWVFAPNTLTPTSTSYNLLYPGDAYVDWIGLDGYNWGNTQLWSHWESFNQVFSNSYTSLVALAPSKPMMLSEVNTTESGGDKAAWYQDMLATQIPEHFPKIAAVVFYNEDRTAQEKVNWLIDSSASSLASFSHSIDNKMYLSSF